MYKIKHDKHQDLFCFSVKPNPPHNLSVTNSEELSSILKLTWINSSVQSFIRLKYSIQYRTKDTSTWSEVS